MIVELKTADIMYLATNKYLVALPPGHRFHKVLEILAIAHLKDSELFDFQLQLLRRLSGNTPA